MKRALWLVLIAGCEYQGDSNRFALARNCSEQEISSEICDGQDNDCDGDIDETFGLHQDCVLPNGCVGQRECAGELSTQCLPLESPEAGEPCGVSGAAGAPVTVTITSASSGGAAGVPFADECIDGQREPCGSSLGECDQGERECVDGRWLPCDAKGPSEDVCDGLDNDCDGDIDETCDCTTGTTRACGSSVGACEPGLQTCVTGSWSECEGGVLPSAEVCDTLDNDCDGSVNNGLDIGAFCVSADSCPGTLVCAEGLTGSECVVDPTRLGEEICDEIDNDCDGLVDLVVEGGSLVSPCECRARLLMVGDASDVSSDDPSKFCRSTRCGGETIPGLSIDGTCYPVCQTESDPDGDGWGWEGGGTCIVEDSPRGSGAALCEGDEIPKGMAISYCLDCSGTEDLPFAMCQSVPRLDLRAFGRGELWLRVDYSYLAFGPAPAPVNLWFDTGDGRRKHLPLVSPGDVPDRYQRLLRVDEACFTASDLFGTGCRGQGEPCAHCGSEEVCGAIDACGQYDLGEAWLQVAAEFCGPGIGEHAGTVTIHQIELVEPACE